MKRSFESPEKEKYPGLIKLFRIVNLMTFLLLITVTWVFSNESYSQTKVFNLTLEKATVKKVLSTIEAQSEFHFMYSSKFIDVNRQVSINVKNQKIEEILELLFSETNISYTIKDKFIILKTSVLPKEGTLILPQEKTIKGRVSDSKGQPLAGVTIIVKGSTTGTISDADGNFSLAIPDDAKTLLFSFVGMRMLEIPIEERTTFEVTMEEEPIGLDEVVAIGYGTMKRSDITGSVASVNMNNIKNQPVRSLSDMLSGRVAGMYLSRTSGAMGNPSKIRIRGANSIQGNNSPLTVVDGVIGAPIGPIQDIESIEVLKDASATAIYGERASNGVILVTTKKATSAEPLILVSLSKGVSYRNTVYKDKMNAAEYAEYINDFKETEIFSEAEIAEFRRTGGTDWLDVINQVGAKDDHQISYSQKLDKLSVYMSGRFDQETGTMVNTKSGGNYTVRSKIGFQPSKRLKMDLDITASKSKTRNGGLSTSVNKSDSYFQALNWSPTEPIWIDKENGVYNNIDHHGALLDNPYMHAMEQNRFGEYHQATSLLNASYKIADFLDYNLTGFAAKSGSASGEYRNKWLEPTNPYASRWQSEDFSWRLINKLDFHKSFDNAHNVRVTGVYESEASEWWSLSGTGEKMPLPDLASYWTIGLSNVQNTSSGYGKSSRIAYMGRLNYNYKSRYYFTASYRVDGKSGPENRVKENKFGGFPSFAASWRLSEESFMKDNGIFQNLKLRAGWGQTGNPCPWIYTTMKSYDFNYGLDPYVLGYVPGTPANPFLKWETTTQIDLGLDLTTFNGRLSVSFDYFDKLTEDLLTTVDLPMYFGYGKNGSYFQNLGEVSNKGFEITVDFTPVQTSDFIWDVNFNLSRVKNRVLDLGVQGAFMTGTRGHGMLSEDTYRVQEDLPLGTIWGYKWLGIWQETESAEASSYGNVPGDYKYEDVNNDGAYNLQDDGQVIGDANPDFVWAFNNLISYKNFDFSLLIQGMQGQDIFNLVRAGMSTVHSDARTIMLKRPATDYWTPSNTDAEYKNIHSTSDAKRLNSSQWIEDGSWVKVKHVGITYNVPRKWIKFGTLALTFSAQEVLTFTKYTGLDPEVSASGGSDLWGGCDFGTQPIPTTITFGVSLEF